MGLKYLCSSFKTGRGYFCSIAHRNSMSNHLLGSARAVWLDGSVIGLLMADRGGGRPREDLFHRCSEPQSLTAVMGFMVMD